MTVGSAPYDRAMPSRILLVEDDHGIGASLVAALEGDGHLVRWADDARSARAAFTEAAPDLVLLDVGLPDADGIALCRWFRDRRNDVPVVVVTARDAEIDVIVGLDAGATDYVTKPFSSAVLCARVRAHLRSGRASTEEVIEVGSLRIDRGSRTVVVDQVDVTLRRREFDLLVVLAAEAGRVVSRERLLADLWDVTWDTSSRSLDMHVLSLRRRLGGDVEITTVRGVGYRLELG